MESTEGAGTSKQSTLIDIAMEYVLPYADLRRDPRMLKVCLQQQLKTLYAICKNGTAPAACCFLCPDLAKAGFAARMQSCCRSTGPAYLQHSIWKFPASCRRFSFLQ